MDGALGPPVVVEAETGRGWLVFEEVLMEEGRGQVDQVWQGEVVWICGS